MFALHKGWLAMAQIKLFSYVMWGILEKLLEKEEVVRQVTTADMLFCWGMLRITLTWLKYDPKGGKIKDSCSVDQRCHQLIWGHSSSCETLFSGFVIPAHLSVCWELSLRRVTCLCVDCSPRLVWHMGRSIALPGAGGETSWVLLWCGRVTLHRNLFVLPLSTLSTLLPV